VKTFFKYKNAQNIFLKAEGRVAGEDLVVKRKWRDAAT
jgi:hypothetical protein